MSGSRGDRDQPITDINVTPLVDVVLVLLIILMVTASTIVASAIPTELPSARSGENQPHPPLTVVVDADGAFSVDEHVVTDEELRARAMAFRRDDPEGTALISADGRVPHARVVHLIDVLRLAGVTKLGFAVVPEGDG